MSEETHWSLQAKLAKSFDRLKYKVFTERGYGTGDGRIDVMAIAKSYRREIKFYEVKASQRDFEQDLKNEKWQKYLPYCDKLYFALGPALDHKKCLDALKNCPVGVVVYKDNHWAVKRGAPPTAPKQIPEHAWIAFLIGNEEGDTRLARMEAEAEKLRHLELKQLCRSASVFLRNKASELLEQSAVHEVGKAAYEQEVRRKIAEELGMYWCDDDVQALVGRMMLRDLQRKIEAEVGTHVGAALSKLRKCSLNGGEK